MENSMSPSIPSDTALEAIEQDAWSDMFDAAPSPFAFGAGLSQDSVSGMACYAIKAAPTVQFNRAQAYAWPANGDIHSVIAWLISRCSPRWALQLSDRMMTPATRSSLASAGLVEDGSWTKFVRSVDRPYGVGQGPIQVFQVPADLAQEFGQTIQQGFAAPPSFALWSASLVGRRNWTTFLALDDGQIAGAASLYVKGDLGWLGMGCCLPDARRRGVQTALIARRIAHARDLGARWVVSETGTPQLEDPGFHASYHNLGKLGFAPAYRRLCFRAQISGSDMMNGGV
jgi:GNAT superfamily N-acetyltransferase